MAEEKEIQIEVKGSEDKQESSAKPPVLIALSSSYSEQNTLSSENFEVDNRSKIIKWGANNLLPDFLIKVSKTKSTKHSAIISRKCKMIAGNGWQKPESAKAQAFIENKYGSKDLNVIAKLVANDYEVLNLFAIGVRWNSTKTEITAIDYIPAHKVRKSTIGSIWKVSDNWKEPGKKGSNTQIKLL